MRRALVLPALASLTLTACGPTIQVQMMRAADVTVPNEIQRVAVIDRSRSANVGQGILGALEGAVTGEAIGADNGGRREAIRGLTETLRSGPRFEVAQPMVDDADQTLWDREMSWDTVMRICPRQSCDAVVALEAFDSDSSTDFTSRDVERTLDNGTKRNVTEWTARRDTRVLTAWRMYQPKGQHIVDDLRDHTDTRTWQQTGDSRSAARNRLPAQSDTVSQVGYYAGTMYAMRIAPTPVVVYRHYYGGGNPALKLGKNSVKARDWEGAADIWRGLVDDPDPKVRGRAAFNLAVYHEVAGRLDQAAAQAREAAVLLGNGRARTYVATLDQRVRDRDRIQEQLAAPPPEQAPAVPADTPRRTRPPNPNAPVEEQPASGMRRP